MWQRSFVATTVALGDTVDDALAALGSARRPLHGDGDKPSASPVGLAAAHEGTSPAPVGSFRVHDGPSQAHDGRSASHVAAAQLAAPDLDVAASELVAQLRAPHRATRAAALARAVHEIVLRIDEGRLR